MAQVEDRFLFSVTDVPRTLRVARFAGVEALCELFHLEITFASEEGVLEIEDVLGRTACLTLIGKDGDDRYVHGVVSRFEEGDAGKKVTLYHATIVPNVWRLQHRHDCRIFQEMTAPEIVKKVLEGARLVAGDDFRLALQGSYRTREYCVQYRESDWAFVCRLLEEEGIGWFFEHHADKHVLVLVDRAAGHSPIAGANTVPFRPPLGALMSEEHVNRFHYAGEVRSGKITVRDYNFQKPALLLEGEARGAADTDLEIYDYPGIYEAPSEGTDVAQIRLEERQALRRVGDGESACPRFAPGFTFTLSEHTREGLNRGYLITRLEYQGFEPSMGEDASHEGAVGATYENRFECIPSNVPFRPARVTPKPVMRGVQTAIVVGPSGEEIYTDRFGRVKVQFHWDRLGKKDERSSCWMRVSQVWAGEAWGAMHIPRVNQEVIVDFLEGDPDRPLVVGRVYHGTNLPPHTLPSNKTMSTIKSNSTPGGGGFNELRFEDKKGSEEIFLHGQKDMNVVIEHDATRRVGHDESHHVEHDRALEVDNDQREHIHHDRTRKVGNDETAEIGHNRTIKVGADHVETISGNMSHAVTKTRTDEIGEDMSFTVGGKLAVGVTSAVSLDMSADMALTVGGASTEEVKLDKAIKVGTKVVLQCGDTTITVEKSGAVKIEGKNIAIDAGSGPIKLSGQSIAVSSSGEVKIEASGKVEVKGSGQMNIDASGPVKLRGANVGIN
ncbi:VgrG protein [Minicystis rosea]|nr:VgrG protein [Minicystis rosea]